jgi:hypothetical protein
VTRRRPHDDEYEFHVSIGDVFKVVDGFFPIVMRQIAIAAYVEYLKAHILAILLGAEKHEVGVAALMETIFSSSRRSIALKAAAKEILSGPDYECLELILAEASQVEDERDTFSHFLWQPNPKKPEELRLLQPRDVSGHDVWLTTVSRDLVRTVKAWQKGEKKEGDQRRIQQPPPLRHMKTTWVYTTQDAGDALSRAVRAHQLMVLFVQMLLEPDGTARDELAKALPSWQPKRSP